MILPVLYASKPPDTSYMKLTALQVKEPRNGYLLLASIAILAVIVTYLVAAADLSTGLKITLLVSTTAIYLAIIAAVYFAQSEHKEKSAPEKEQNIFGGEIEEKLLVLEEASQFFSVSLKSVDMFQLIAGRIGEIVPFAICALFLFDESKKQLKITYAAGDNAGQLKDLTLESNRGLAGKAFLSRKPQHDEKLVHDKSVMPMSALKNLDSSIAAPLKRGGGVFGVLQLFGDSERTFNEDSLQLLDAVGERVAALLAGSLAFERSLSNAITDSLTNLPNERAFYLMLEKQIAEAERLPEKRQLSVLAMDIKNFADLNRRYGHAAGDLMLVFAAKIIKKQLRRMDFLARSVNDEFLVILPTASLEVTETVIERVEKAFSTNHFTVSKNEKIDLNLNFGAASFLTDGETAQKLLQIALLKKQQGKSPQKNQVVIFPQEFAN